MTHCAQREEGRGGDGAREREEGGRDGAPERARGGDGAREREAGRKSEG